jgi:hypothetical protein
MQLIATGKWSKAEKRWNLLVALRRPPASTSGLSPKRAEPRRGSQRRPQPPSGA